jgi:hypothetical protein
VRCPILNRDEQRAVANRFRSNSALRLPALTASPGLRRALPGVLFALLVIGVYAGPLFFRRNFAGRDLLTYNLPVERAVHDAYARGRLPVWIPEISGGRPLLPNPNSGAFYPVRPLLSLVRFPAAARLYPVLPPGAHRIEWKERVPGGEISRFGPVLSIAAAAALLAKDRRRT